MINGLHWQFLSVKGGKIRNHQTDCQHLEGGFKLPEIAGGNHYSIVRRHQPKTADNKFPCNDDNDDPRGNPLQIGCAECGRLSFYQYGKNADERGFCESEDNRFPYLPPSCKQFPAAVP